MVPLETIRELFRYNYWARDRQLDACASLSTEQFLKPLGNSFSSLRDTLAHLLFAEWIWKERWLGRSPQSFPKADDYADLAAIREAWRPVEKDIREHLASVSEETIAGRFTFTRTSGETFSYPRWRSMLHLANHQTYHRGQVTMFLRQFGFEPPGLDLVLADMHGVLESPGAPKYFVKAAQV
ncbi:MAG TPA: DinB family protein [Bryobacteraceae bacterium]|nr:DinB family protein [Bryobacteraceae bacterium]